MRMDRRALNRNTLPFIDLHQERRLEQNRRAVRNTRRLLGLGILVLIQGSALLPLTAQSFAFVPQIVRAENSLAATDKRLAAATQANTGLEPGIRRWERYQKSREARRQMTRAFLAAAQDLPRDVYIERLQVDAQDKQIRVQLQGVAESQTILKDCLTALSARPEFSGLHLTDTTDAAIAGRREIRFHAEVIRDN